MIKMLRCGQCGSTKFFFTVGNNSGGHHGAICACCRKQLNSQDTGTGLSILSKALSTALAEKVLNQALNKQ